MVRSVTTAEADWSGLDRGLVLALLAEQAETCSNCAHPMTECRDAATAGQWEVVDEVCQPSRVAEAVLENAMKAKRRGVVVSTRRTTTA